MDNPILFYLGVACGVIASIMAIALVFEDTTHPFVYPTDKCTSYENIAADWMILGYDVTPTTLYRNTILVRTNTTVWCVFEKVKIIEKN